MPGTNAFGLDSCGEPGEGFLHLPKTLGPRPGVRRFQLCTDAEQIIHRPSPASLDRVDGFGQGLEVVLFAKAYTASQVPLPHIRQFALNPENRARHAMRNQDAEQEGDGQCDSETYGKDGPEKPKQGLLDHQGFAPA